MSDMTKRLRDRRQNVWEEAKGLADSAAEANRAFSAEEQGTWDALNDELNKLDARIKSALDTETRQKEQDDAFLKLEAKPRGDGKRDSAQGGDGGEAEAELRSFMTGESRARYYDVLPSRRVDFRTLSKLTAAAGLNTVPTSFYDRLMAHLIETSAVLQAGVTVLNTSSGEVMQVPKTTAHSSAAIFAEAGTITNSDPAFGQVSLGAFKYGVLFQVSRELLSDAGVDLEGYLSMQAGRALGNKFGADLVTGAGTTAPRGLTLDTTLGVTGATSVVGAFTPDNLIDLFYSVIQPYRNSSSCYWLMKDATLAAVRKLKDTTGQYLWQPSYQVGAPDTILGKPVLTDPAVAAVATTNKSVIFGDFSQYFVRIAGGVRFERSDDFAFNADLTTFRALLRGDGALVDLTGALKHFVGGAT